MKLLLLLCCCISLTGMQPDKKDLVSMSKDIPSNPLTIDAVYEAHGQKREEFPSIETPESGSNDTIDSIPIHRHHRALLTSNMITALGTATITAIVTIAVAYINNKCGVNLPGGNSTH